MAGLSGGPGCAGRLLPPRLAPGRGVSICAIRWGPIATEAVNRVYAHPDPDAQPDSVNGAKNLVRQPVLAAYSARLYFLAIVTEEGQGRGDGTPARIRNPIASRTDHASRLLAQCKRGVSERGGDRTARGVLPDNSCHRFGTRLAMHGSARRRALPYPLVPLWGVKTSSGTVTTELCNLPAAVSCVRPWSCPRSAMIAPGCSGLRRRAVLRSREGRVVWCVLAHRVAFLVDLVIGTRPGSREKDSQILVLRHQVRILRRQRPRPPGSRGARSRTWPSWPPRSPG